MTIEADIQKIYIAYFNRPADYAGLIYWKTEIDSGRATLETLTSSFATTAEYNSLYGSSLSAMVVTKVYQNLFGREPEEAGLKYWVGELDSGRVTIGTVAYSALTSAAGNDKLTIDHKAEASAAFTAKLSAQGDAVDYSGALLTQARAWLGTINENAASVSVAGITMDGLFPGSTPATPAKTYDFTIGWNLSIPTGPDFDYDNAAALNFRLGYDKINLTSVNPVEVNVSGSTYFYFADFSSFGGAVAPGQELHWAVLEALGFAHNGSSGSELTPLKLGESVLIAFQVNDKLKTYLFIDDMTSGDPGGVNGPGSASWNIDADRIIDVTGITGVKLNADGVTIAGDFFV